MGCLSFEVHIPLIANKKKLCQGLTNHKNKNPAISYNE